MRWVPTALLALAGSWMVFDGARAIMVGDYITPSRGEYAGELGPWSHLVEAIGIPARSTAMKTTFIVIGLFHLTAAGSLAFSAGSSSTWLALVAAVTGLWYLPFGTAADAVALAVIVLSPLRPW